MIPVLLALMGCKGDPTPEVVVDPGPPAACDAGDEAWVQRAIPLMWGRRAQGSAEVRVWADMVAQHGREAVVRAMATEPEYKAWWRQWITDALAVARTGDKAYSDCYGAPVRDAHDGSLTSWIRSVDEPWTTGQADGGNFNMADVILDALEADDLAIPWQVHLYARMNRPVQGANVSEQELEYNRRVNFGEVFFETYLNRNLDCVLCHNSQYSTTDDPDARFDLTWQLPGHHETALLGSNTGFSKDAAYSMFRVAGVLRSQTGRRPFGISAQCGRLRTPSGIDGPDFIGQDETFFIESYGAEGSVWQLERSLAEGADALATHGLLIGPDGEVDGRQSFAYLLGARIVDLVYQEATGGRLTIAHGFPRNLDQAARLEALTDHFVESGFSLRELLVDITADELFNPGLPGECEMQTYGLDPVVNPWSVEESDPERRKNGAGDLVHRHSARALTYSANAHLGWGPPRSWQLPEEEEEFQASIGVFLRESQPGFRGTDFQGLLAMHDRYATCARPPGAEDWIDGLFARSTGARAEDLVFALKDRLLADGTIAEAERPLLETLLGPLDAPAGQVEPAALRAVCGAILTSPAYTLAIAPGPPGDIPALGDDPNIRCEAAISAMQRAGFATTTCNVTD